MKKLKNIVLIIILILLTPIIFISLVITIDSYIHKDKIPSFFGWKPFIVLSGSMESQINVGDIVVVKEIETNKLKEGDVIAFRNGDIVIIHRIIEKEENAGKIQYITKGDNNNVKDKGKVQEEQIEGIYKFKIIKLGNIAMFIQTPLGAIALISTPVILLLIIYIDENRKEKEYVEQKEKELNDMIEEIKRLKRQSEEFAKRK